ncbi:MAG: DUF1080 domain-containing protein [Balneolales bacterium]
MKTTAKPCFASPFRTFYLLLAGGFLLSALTACGKADSTSQPNTLTTEEVREGWELVFDGQTLQGWRGLNREDVPAENWMVENGMLKKVSRDSIATGPDGERPRGGDLLLDRTVHNFEFAFEWVVSPVANSGVKYNVSEEFTAANGSRHSALGFEYQVLDDPEYPDIAENKSWATAGLYELVDPGPNARLNPVGEWNTGRIVFDGNHGEHWLNGELVLTYELDTAEMDSAFAGSKWSHIDGFISKHENAYITLQDHGNSVWYRNLKLKELP